MGFTCGIVGLPNVGKTTLFNAITSANAHVANYPFCTIDPNVGIVPVPDNRLKRIAEIYKSAKIVPTTLEFLDIAGLVKNASKGEGLGNQFLSHIRTVDAIAHVVRCFEDPNVTHVNGVINPKYDIEIVETELILKDIETVEKKILDASKRVKANDKKAKAEEEFYHKLKTHLLSGKPARSYNIKDDECFFWMQDLHLLTSKAVMYICNVHEKDLNKQNPYVDAVKKIADSENAKTVIISAEIEAEIAKLPENERADFMAELGLSESGLSKVIKTGYELLQLVTFFTANENEAHARTAKIGTTVVEAARLVHSDFEKKFIRAEVIKFQDLDRLGSELAVREAGILHIQGRDYVIEDGDIIFYKI